MKTFEKLIDAAWQEFKTLHPYSGETHEATFKYAYWKALKDIQAQIEDFTEKNTKHSDIQFSSG